MAEVQLWRTGIIVTTRILLNNCRERSKFPELSNFDLENLSALMSTWWLSLTKRNIASIDIACSGQSSYITLSVSYYVVLCVADPSSISDCSHSWTIITTTIPIFNNYIKREIQGLCLSLQLVLPNLISHICKENYRSYSAGFRHFLLELDTNC